MNILEALKLAKETGAKVRPTIKGALSYRYYDSANDRPKRLFRGNARVIALPVEYLVNRNDGSPVEWEKIPA